MTELVPAHLRSILVCLLLALALGGPAAAAGPDSALKEPLDLEGSWYVLVHYRDRSTANPDSDRWLDLAWTFARKGKQLEWTEYAIVFFEDASGRFESAGGNPRSRVLHAWEPNTGQLGTITKGPQVSKRGVKVKALRGSDARGWTVQPRATQHSAMSFSYQEGARISDLAGHPVFLRTDQISGAGTNAEGGHIEYAVEQVHDGGSVLTGRYERDESRWGTFRMWRTAPVRGLPKRDRRKERAEAYRRELNRRADAGDEEAQRERDELIETLQLEPPRKSKEP
jgi:hypothetical protein